jgi:DNA-binding CsgD family transcriptional regulator
MPRIQRVIETCCHPSAWLTLLERSEEVAGLGAWAYTTARDELVWSDNMYRLYGLEPGTIVPTPEYAVSCTHPEDRDPLTKGIASAPLGGEVSGITYRIRLPDGRIRHHEVVVAFRASVPPDEVFVGSVRDVTDQQHAQREIATHLVVSEALSEWKDLDTGAAGLLEKLGERLDCVRGVLWLPADGVLVPRVVWLPPKGAELDSELTGLCLAPGDGIAGRAWVMREVVSFANIARERSYQFMRFAERHGLRGALAIPAIKGDEVLAVVGLVSREEFVLTDRLRATLSGISSELGEFLAHRRGQLTQPRLTGREREVLQLAASGSTVKETAMRLSVSRSTVKTHLEHAYAKLEVADRAAAVAKALRLGLID